jgi:hypothetical protein
MALKIKIKRIAGVPTTSDLESGEIGLNTSNNQLYVNISGTITAVSGGGGGGGADLSAVDQDILPDADGTRNIGSATKRFAELFLTGNTINLGGATIDSDGTGTISISGDGVTLPNNSSLASGEKLAVANDEGVPIRKVNLFTAAGGLSTAATTLNFKASASRDLVFTGLTLTNGQNITSTQQTTLFEF